MQETIDENLLLFSSKFAKQKEYWANKLSGHLAKTGILLKDRGHDLTAETVNREREKIEIHIPEPLARQVGHLSKNSALSVYMVLLTTLNVLIGKYSDNQEPTIISPVYQPKVSRETINKCVFIRNTITGNMTFKELLLNVRQSTLDAYENQDYPSHKLIKHVLQQENPGYGMISDIWCLLENIHDKGVCNGLKEILAFSFSFEKQVPRISGFIYYDTAAYERIYLEQMAHHFVKILESCMEEMSNPLSSITLLSEVEKHQLLVEFNDTDAQPPREKTIHQLFAEQVEKNPDHMALVAQSAERKAQCGEGCYAPCAVHYAITYRELNRQANCLAQLLRKKGVQPDTIAGLVSGRSIEIIVGIMGILKAGAAYLPIDANYPEERINYMLEDSASKIVVTTPDYAKEIKFEKEIINITDTINRVPTPHHLHLSPAPATSLAYVIYTSGTTGKPKGVMLEHQSVVNLVSGLEKRIYDRYKKPLSIAVISPYVFDASVKQVFAALLLRHCLYIVPESVRIDAFSLLEFYKKYQIEVSDGTPTHLRLLLEALKENQNPLPLSVGHFIIGGEALSRELVEKFLNCITREKTPGENKTPIITNVYGPTECSVDSTSYDVSTKNIGLYNHIPLGKPMPNYRVYILGREKELLPTGIPGELSISGPGVGRGYLNNPEFTAEKFFDKALSSLFLALRGTQRTKNALRGCNQPGAFQEIQGARSQELRTNCHTLRTKNQKSRAKLYKTGDLARWMPDGNIIFLGRIDHQVKIRGFRIELEEIQSLLLRHQMVKEVVVAATEKNERDRYLCAYIVPNAPDNTGSLDENGLREYLAAKLPDYVIPSYFVQMERIPLTPNGKIDREALPAPAIEAKEVYVAPSNKIEKQLAEIWAEVLSRDTLHALSSPGQSPGYTPISIGVDANFFHLGGHSLKATILAAKIQRLFNVKLPLPQIFKTPTIRELARYIKTEAVKDKFSSIKPIEKKEYYPLSSPQKRLYILQQMELSNTAYNMPQLIPIKNDPDMGKIESAFLQLVNRHKSLRTSFRMVREKPAQRIHNHVEFKVEYFDLATEDTEITEAVSSHTPHLSSENRIIHHFLRPFDLSRAPLIRAKLIKNADGNHFLFIDMHHIICDGVSHYILEKDFTAFYQGEKIPPLRIQYKDFVDWKSSEKQEELIHQQEVYWLNEFSGQLPVLDLPIDYPRPFIQTFAGNRVWFSLTGKENQTLKDIAKKTNTTPYMVILSIYTILLAKLSGQEDIIIGTPVLGRRHVDLKKIVGMFVNTLALRNYPHGNQTFKDFLHQVKERTLQAFENQEYQFEDLVDKISLHRDTSRNPVFDVVFNYLDRTENQDSPSKEEEQNPTPPEYEHEGNDKSEYQHRKGAAKFDIILRAVQQREKLSLGFEYCTRLFKQETIDRIIDYLKNIITSVAKNPGKKIKNIELISLQKRQRILFEFNKEFTGIDINPFQTRLFNSFHKLRSKIALEYGESRITYFDLDVKSSAISDSLMRSGIKKGSFIGIHTQNKIDVISTMVGILKAGAVFIPLDTSLPVKRIATMIRCTKPDLIFTDTLSIKNLTKSCKDIEKNSKLVIVDDAFYQECDRLPAITNNVEYSKEDQIYIYFTSGTTSVPRAIIGKNISLSHFVEWEIHTFAVDRESRVSQLAAVGFDAFLRNVFTPLCAGGTVCIPGIPNLVLDGSALRDWIDENKITFIHCVPSVFRLVTREVLTGKRFPHLKYVLLSGESINPAELKPWYDIFADRIQLVNCYGATETTIIKTFHPIRQSDLQKSRIPAGVPMPGSRLIILDHNMNICDRGIVGEVYIKTPYGTCGYLNNPELTAEGFIKNPFSQDETEILYKTGDLGRELENGEIEIRERFDRQVKIRGVRIQLESIENCLLNHPQVEQAITVARKDTENENYLCAYIVKKNKKEENYYSRDRLTRLLQSESEKSKLLFDFNFANDGDSDDSSKNKTIAASFKTQALKTPDHVVIISRDQHITYQKLHEKANQLSLILKNSGITKDKKVGILLENSLEIVIGMLAILKTGAQCLPLDPRHESQRIHSILASQQAPLLLTNDNVAKEKTFTVLLGLKPGKNKLTVPSPRAPIPNLNHLPIPDRSLVNYEKYTQYIGQSLIKNSISLLGSRGCPYHCLYCHKIWPKKQITRSAENIFEELILYYKIGFKRFVFLDDIFNLNVENTTRFFRMIIKRRLDIQLCLNLRGDILTREYIDLMVNAGVIRIAVALETASPRLQKIIGKNLNIERFKKNMEYICKCYPQLILEINTMHGFPSETPEEAALTLDFIKNLKWVHFPYINILKIYPNTGMEKLALAKGISQEAIDKSASLAYHELPDTLPFDKSFTKKYQLEFMSGYFLETERLLHVLPHQLNVLTEDEIIQKYNSYLPVEINSIEELLEFANISKKELNLESLKKENGFEIPGLNQKIKAVFPLNASEGNPLKILALDLSQLFSIDGKTILYDVVEAPLGLMYLVTYINRRFGGKIQGKIAKSRIDFDNYGQLKSLVDEFKPDVIGIRTLTYFKDFFHKTIAVIRLWGTDVPIIAGGPYATSDYQTMLQDRNVDLAVLGEGEETLSQLLEAIIDNNGKLPGQEKLKKIPGIAFVPGEENHRTEEFNRVILMDAIESRASSASYQAQPNPDHLTAARAASILFPDNKENVPTPAELREYLSDEFPAYMIPSYFVPIEKVPLTPNGKIDWKALPEPKFGDTNSDYAAPRNEIEEKLAQIWQEVLFGSEALNEARNVSIGIDDDFFASGGHSLKATRMVSKIHKELNVKLPLAEIFKNPTIRGLSRYIKETAENRYTAIEPVEKKEYYPLSSLQKRMYFLQQMDLESSAYNMPNLISLEAEDNKEELEKTFKKLIQRHESLRTSFHIIDDTPMQRIHCHVKFKIENYVITGSPMEAKIQKSSRNRDCWFLPSMTSVVKHLGSAFDLSRAPLLKVGIIKLQDEKYVLAAFMHHIISDGISREILLKDFIALHENRQLAPLQIQYKDFSEWQNSRKQMEHIKKQEEFWIKELDGEIPILNLPTDYEKSGNRNFSGGFMETIIPQDQVEALRTFEKSEGVTMYMIILTLFNILLFKISSQKIIQIGTFTAGRPNADLENIIGMFVNTLVMRNYPAEEKTFREFLEEVKQRALDAFAHQDYQYDQLVNKVAKMRTGKHNPLFNVALSFRSRKNSTAKVESNLNIEKDSFDIQLKFDLGVTVIEYKNQLLCLFSYYKDLFKKETIKRFSGYFQEIISAVIKKGDMLLREIAISSDLAEAESDIILEDEMGFGF